MVNLIEFIEINGKTYELPKGGSGGGTNVDISGKLDKSEFNTYSAKTDTAINNKVSKDEFASYKDTVTSELNNKVNKTTYEAYTISTNNALQKKADMSYVDSTFVRQGELDEYVLILQDIDGKELSRVDLSSLVNKGMVKSVEIVGEELVITWNDEAGGMVTRIPLSDIFNPENFYTKDQTNKRIESRHVFFEKYEDFEKSARSSGVTYYIEDIKTIVHNEVEFKSMSWAKFLGENEQEYMPLAAYNKETNRLELRYFSELDELSSTALEKLVPVGLVIIPEEHDVYEDGSCGVMSLVYMSCDTPEVGCVGKKVGYAGDDGAHFMYFGNTAYIKNGNDVKLPHLGPMGDGNNKLDPKTTKQGTTTEKVAIPNNMNTGVQSISDPYGHYPDSVDAKRYYGISPYIGYDEGRNDMYSSDSLAVYNGKDKTNEILELATGQSDWRTDSKITNSVNNGYYPAACTCYRYHTEGTHEGDWYLPSIAELGYMIARTKKINDTLEHINILFGTDYANPIDYTNNNAINIWSTQPHSVSGGSITTYGTGTSVLVSTVVDNGSNGPRLGSTRAFMKLKF